MSCVTLHKLVIMLQVVINISNNSKIYKAASAVVGALHHISLYYHTTCEMGFIIIRFTDKRPKVQRAKVTRLSLNFSAK